MKTAWLLYLIFGVLMFWNRISWPWSPDSPASTPQVLRLQGRATTATLLAHLNFCWCSVVHNVGFPHFPMPLWHLASHTLWESPVLLNFSTAVTVLHRGFASSSGSYCHQAPDMWVPTPRLLLCTFFATRFNNVLMSRVTSWGSPCQLHQA